MAYYVSSGSLKLTNQADLCMYVGVVESVGISQGVSGVRQTAAGGCTVCRCTSVSVVNTVDADTQPASFWAVCCCCRCETRNYQTTREVGLRSCVIWTINVNENQHHICSRIITFITGFIPFTGTGIRIGFVMHPQSSSTGHNASASVTVTVSYKVISATSCK